MTLIMQEIRRPETKCVPNGEEYSCWVELQWQHSPKLRVCVAHKSVKENHADVSSAAAEVYAVGNVANELLGQSYAVDEMGTRFPTTAILQVDNTTAISFSGDS